MTTQKFQRRTVLVKQSLQLKYIAVIFLSVVLGALIVGGDIYYTMTKLILTENPSLAAMITQVNSMIMFKMVLYLGIIFLVSLFVSHRFAGPIYRFEKSAQAVAGGDLTHRVSLRTGDDLLELQEEFNAMVSALQSLVQKDQDLVSQIAQRLEEVLARLPDDARSADLRKDLEALKGDIERVSSSFKV